MTQPAPRDDASSAAAGARCSAISRLWATHATAPGTVLGDGTLVGKVITEALREAEHGPAPPPPAREAKARTEA